MTAKVHTEHKLANETTFCNAEVRINKGNNEIEVTPKRHRWSNNLRIYAKEGLKVLTRQDGSYMLYCALEADCGKNVKELVKSFKEAIKGTEEYEKRLKR